MSSIPSSAKNSHNISFQGTVVPELKCWASDECARSPHNSALSAATKSFLMPCRVLLMVCCLAALLAGCSTVRTPSCAAGEQRSVSELLYFGTAKPMGVVSSEEWSAFLGGVVTPRFPQGLSAWQASGQWQSADGSLTRENSFVLNLVHPQGEQDDNAIQAIVAEYKSRFRQEAVLRVKSYACVSF